MSSSSTKTRVMFVMISLVWLVRVQGGNIRKKGYVVELYSLTW
jgi:hypothetical protein